MSQPRIALIVDHPQRDLAGLVLTAVELCQRGAVCHLVPLNHQEGEVWSLAPDFVLLNFFRRSNQPFARRLLSAGIGYGLLDTEGGVWKDVGAYSELLWRDDALMKRAACVCLWGTRMADHLVADDAFARSQVAVTGCPRFDFYDPAWRSVLCDAPGNGSRPKRPTVLINTLYNTVNSRLVSAKSNAEQLETVHGWTRARVNAFLDAESQAIEAVVELAGRLSTDFPEADILLRPHPFESPEPYQRGLAAFPNVCIDGEGSVTPRIFGSVAVIQRSCTTSIEAALAGVPALSPQWVPAPSLNPMAEAVSEPSESYAALQSQLRSILDGRYERSTPLRDAIDQVVVDWFHRSDGKAHERVGEAVSLSWPRDRIVDERLCRRYQYGLGGAPVPPATQLGQRVRYAAGLSPNWSFSRFRRVPRPLKSAKAFGLEDVAPLVRRIESAWRDGGRSLSPVRALAASERGDYANGFLGRAVTVTCEP